MKPTSSQPVRAAIYLRISLDREMDGLAIDRQREDCEKLAQFRGWEIVETYVDQSISASDKTKKRPAYLRMVADYEAGLLDAIVCYDLDRLARQPRELEDWIDRAESRGLLLVTANGDADLGTDGGRMYARIKAAVARAEVERKGARQSRAHVQRARQGRPPKGVCPMGYTTAGELIPHEAEAVVPSTLPSFEGTRCTESHAPSAALRPTARRRGFRACPCTVGRSSSNAMLDGRLRASSFARCPMTSPGHPRRCSASCGTLAMRGTRSTPRRTLVGRRPGNRAVRPCPRQG